jgi:Flp pilus assembly protein protease CpaA
MLSNWVYQGGWWFFRGVALALPSHKDRLLAYGGPSLLILTVLLWVLLLLFGFALIVWPALGSAIQASSGGTPMDFAAALYYAGFSLTTLGAGDIVPLSAPYRLLTVLMAAVGFSVLTLSLTFFTSVYSALLRRNTFALSLHHRALGKADAVVLLTHLGPDGDFSNARSELTMIAEELINLYESHHFYPVLHYSASRETPIP